MAGCTYTHVLTVSVITEILLLCVAQNTHMENVAVGKPCGISSTWTPGDTCSAAINGNNINLYYPGNCIHTAYYDKSPFWWVDLKNEFTISSMTIYGRTSYIERMTQVNIFLDNIIVKRFTSQDIWTNDKHVITVGRVGRMIDITKDSNSGSMMIICEVEVWVCNDGWYGDNCTQNCSYCPSSVCDKVDGNCTTCETGFQLPHCKEPLITTLNTSSSVQATVTEYSSTVGMLCDNDKETVSVAGPVAGAAVGCAVVFFIIGAIFGWWLRKSRSQQQSGRGHSPIEIPLTSDAGISRSTSRPDDKVDNTSDYTNIGNSTNVYDALKAPDDNNTTAYTSLDFHTHTDAHR